MEIGTKSKESILWTLSTGPLLQVVQFVISIILARLLEPRDFGIMGIASIIIFYSNTVSDFGFGDAIVRIKHLKNEHIDSFFTLNLIISLFLALTVYTTAHLLASFFDIPELGQVLRVLALIFILTSFYNIPQALLRRELSYKAIAHIDIMKRIAGFSCTLPLAFLNFGYWALVIGTLSANLMSTLAILHKSGWRPRVRFYPGALKEIAHFASWRFVSVQALLLSNYVDKLIIGKVLGPVLLGFYEKSFGISFMPVQHIAQKISFVMFSTFSRIKSKQKDTVHYFKRTVTLTSVFCLPVLAGLYAVADHFVIVLLGEKWIPMIPCFKILLIGFIFGSLSAPFEILNLSSRNYKIQVKFKLATLFILCVALIFFTKLGLIYAASIVAFNNFLFLCVSCFLARSVVPFGFVDLIKLIMPPTIGCFIMLVCVTLSKKFFYDLVLFDFTILVLSGIISYTMFILCTDFKNLAFLKKEAIHRFTLVINYFKK